MKSLFTYVLLLLSFNLYAQGVDCENPQSVDEVVECFGSFRPNQNVEAPALEICLHGECREEEVYLANTGNRRGSMPGLTSGFYSQGANCESFIARDGSIGPWGNIVVDYIQNSPRRNYFLNLNLPHIEQACPRWRELSIEQREFFWVWTFAAIAWDEARCVSGRRNTAATNGVGTGLLQLDEQRSNRSWRGANCRAQSVAAPRENLRCGLDIMSELLLGGQGVYRGSGAIFRDGRRNTSYWEKLRRPGGGTIGNLIKSLPFCQNPST